MPMRTDLFSRRRFIQATGAAAARGVLRGGDPSEKVTFAIFNRDRKWMNLESEATLENTFTIDTPIGKSPAIQKLRYKGVPFYSIPRYGDPGSSEITSAFDEKFSGERLVQVWVTMMQLGVQYVVHTNLIGGVNPELVYDDMVIIDDFIDMKPDYPPSVLPYFYKDKPKDQWPRSGTRMFPVLCPVLRRAMYDQAVKTHHAKVKYGGTLLQNRSARWETPAEIRMNRMLGADVVCTLDATSITYAKQAGIHFATGQYVMNFAEGSRPMDTGTTSETGFARMAVSMRKTMLETIATLKGNPPKCDCFRPRG
jgi:purine nucleoside phosphorylase